MEKLVESKSALRSEKGKRKSQIPSNDRSRPWHPDLISFLPCQVFISLYNVELLSGEMRRGTIAKKNTAPVFQGILRVSFARAYTRLSVRIQGPEGHLQKA